MERERKTIHYYNGVGLKYEGSMVGFHNNNFTQEQEDTLENLFSQIRFYQNEARTRTFNKTDFESILEITTKILDMGNENDRKRFRYEVEICEIEHKIGVLLREANQQRKNI